MDRYIVLLRRFTENPVLEIVGYAKSDAKAEDLVKHSGLQDIKQGDIFIVISLSKFNPLLIAKNAKRLFVVRVDGRVGEVGKIPKHLFNKGVANWLDAWEGVGTPAEMARATNGRANAYLVALAACDLIHMRRHSSDYGVWATKLEFLANYFAGDKSPDSAYKVQYAMWETRGLTRVAGGPTENLAFDIFRSLPGLGNAPSILAQACHLFNVSESATVSEVIRQRIPLSMILLAEQGK